MLLLLAGPFSLSNTQAQADEPGPHPLRLRETRTAITVENAVELDILMMWDTLNADWAGGQKNIIISPNSDSIAASRYGLLGRWSLFPDLRSEYNVLAVPAHRLLDYDLIYTPGGNQIVSPMWADYTVQISTWENLTGQQHLQVLRFPSGDAVSYREFANDMTYVYSYSPNFNAGTPMLILHGLFFDIDGLLVAYGYDAIQQHMIIWNPYTGEMITSVTLDFDTFDRRAIYAVNNEIWVDVSAESGLQLHSLRLSENVVDIPVNNVRQLVWSRDQRYVALATEDATILVWDLQQAQPAFTLSDLPYELKPDVHDLAFVPAGDLLVISRDVVIEVYNALTGDLINSFDISAAQLDISGDGTVIAAIDFGFNIHVLGVLSP
ncbi:MAG: WD40 repeat domain-containing protein [Blastochloris sp.]|nr:WD40 repeat domain-containing protein [Blastochloris sp.]